MDVLRFQANWSAEPAEALAWLQQLPDRVVDLVLTSPPYEDARTYGVGFKLHGQAWADWLRPIVVECCRVSQGLVAVNMAAKVRHHQYSGAVEFLVADLLRLEGIVCGPSPYAWERPGIAGSGSTHYHRRNWEPVYCFALPDRLPLSWSHNTAFGSPPKWAPGGEMSHRLSNGERVNQWGRHSKGGKSNGDRKTHTKRKPDGEFREQYYAPPVIANPGNVIKTGNGGNQLGHPLAHESEAPMNLALAERFVCWFCRPGAVVLDPFLGSGTTIHSALKHGRRGIGCDVREGKGGVETCVKRIESIESIEWPTPTV